MEKENKLGILVGAAPLGTGELLLRETLLKNHCISVAADGGLSFFIHNRIRPDYWVGDKDSLPEEDYMKAGELFPDLALNPCNPEKDDTDLRLGMLELIRQGISEVYLFGALGGERMDHTIANIQLLHEFSSPNRKLYCIGEQSYLFVLNGGESVRFEENAQGLLSVFSLTEHSELSITGLYYEYEGGLDNKRARGVSNEFCGRGGQIRVKEGAVLVVRGADFKEDRDLLERSGKS